MIHHDTPATRSTLGDGAHELDGAPPQYTKPAKVRISISKGTASGGAEKLDGHANQPFSLSTFKSGS